MAGFGLLGLGPTGREQQGQGLTGPQPAPSMFGPQPGAQLNPALKPGGLLDYESDDPEVKRLRQFVLGHLAVADQTPGGLGRAFINMWDSILEYAQHRSPDDRVRLVRRVMMPMLRRIVAVQAELERQTAPSGYSSAQALPGR